MSANSQAGPGPRRPGRPVPVWVGTDEAGKPIVSFEPLFGATKIYVPMPNDVATLMELHSSVATTMRALADVDNNKDAARILRIRLQTERRQAEAEKAATVQKVPQESPRERKQSTQDIRREYPTESGESVRAWPAGLPDSNRRRH